MVSITGDSVQNKLSNFSGFLQKRKKGMALLFFSELNLFDKVKLVYIYNVILENVVVDIIKFSFSIHRANAELAKTGIDYTITQTNA